MNRRILVVAAILLLAAGLVIMNEVVHARYAYNVTQEPDYQELTAGLREME